MKPLASTGVEGCVGGSTNTFLLGLFKELELGLERRNERDMGDLEALAVWKGPGHFARNDSAGNGATMSLHPARQSQPRVSTDHLGRLGV